MKRYFLLTLMGLIFGLAFGCLEDFFSYLDTLPDPFSANNHWYDLALIIPALFSAPGLALDSWIFNPVDGCYGDEWDSRIPILLFNGLFWMIFIPATSFYAYLARCLPRDVNLAYQKWKKTRSGRRND
jgi:hypothetical protein